MAYPSDPLPVVVQIAPGADLSADPSSWPWEDVTESVLVEGAITYSEGRGEWGAAVDAGSGTVVFRNNAGDFAEDNPLGRWYGLLGRDTPMRFRFRRGADTFSRTVSSGWGTADSGQAWSVAPGVAADFAASGGVATVSHPALDNLLHTALFDVSLLDCEQTVDVAPSVMLTGGALVVGLVFRSGDGDQYWARCEFDNDSTDVILKISKRVGVVETELGVLDPVPGLAYSAGQWLRVCAGIADDQLGIMVWDPSGSAPGWQLQVTVDDADLSRPGAAGVQTWLLGSSTNTLPVIASLRDYQLDVDLWGGFVPAWLPTSDKTGQVRTVPVTGQGVLSRLQPATGTPPAWSPIRHTITSPATMDRLLAYWPCEDGEDATQAASALPSGTPMTASGVTFGDADSDRWIGTVGTGRLPLLGDGGTLTGTVPAGSSTPTAWTVAWMSITSAVTSGTPVVLADWTTPGGTYERWEVKETGTFDFLEVAGYVGAVRTVLLNAFTVGGLAPFWVEAEQSGADVVLRLHVSTEPVKTVTLPGITLARITAATLNPAGVTGMATLYAGHLQVWDAAILPHDAFTVSGVDSYGATIRPYRSWANEPAADRAYRLGIEGGVPVSVPAVAAADVTRMGAQPRGTWLDLLRQCEAADGGILAERPFALAYRPRVSLYNQGPALVLDAASGDLDVAPEPDRAGQAYRNRFVVERIGGTSYVAQLPDAGRIIYEDSALLNLATDDVLPDHAWWRLHLASTPGRRWPLLRLNLLARPALIDAWLNCRVGSRAQVTNPHEDYAGQDIDVLLEGWTVTLGHKELLVSANCSPAVPWRVGEYGVSRYDTAGSQLATGIDAADTSISVATTDGPVWTTDPAALPLDLAVGGERVTVTAIGPAAGGVQAMTVTRAVNGVARAWSAGTPVRLWEPAVYALGATGPAVTAPSTAAGDIIDLADYPGASGPYVLSADVDGAVAGQTIVAES